MAIDDDGTVYATALTLGPGVGESGLARIMNTSTVPKIDKSVTLNFSLGAATVMLSKGEMWLFGGRPNRFQKYNKSSFATEGSSFQINNFLAEQNRAFVDNVGELHAAGTAYNAKGPDAAGWYSTISRVQAGKGAISYKTTNWHACGGSRIVTDNIVKNRVYIVYWSGATGGEYGEQKACAANNQYRFTRIENGVKATEHSSVTKRTAAHGDSYRQTPCGFAHPAGGMVVVFHECGSGNLYWTIVGESGLVTTAAQAAMSKAQSAVSGSPRIVFGEPETGSLKLDMNRTVFYDVFGRATPSHNAASKHLIKIAVRRPRVK